MRISRNNFTFINETDWKGKTMKTHAKPNIVIVGGGFGGLETAFYLRLKLKENVDITLVSDKDYFLFKPNTIYIPFGLDPKKLKISLSKPLRRKHIDFIHAQLNELDPIAKKISTDGRNAMV